MKLEGETKVKEPGSINGQQFIIDNCTVRAGGAPAPRPRAGGPAPEAARIRAWGETPLRSPPPPGRLSVPPEVAGGHASADA